MDKGNIVDEERGTKKRKRKTKAEATPKIDAKKMQSADVNASKNVEHPKDITKPTSMEEDNENVYGALDKKEFEALPFRMIPAVNNTISIISGDASPRGELESFRCNDRVVNEVKLLGAKE